MFRMQRRRISAKNSFIERPSEHSSYYLLWCSPHFIINNNLLFLFRCLSHFLSHSSLALCALCDSVEFSHLRIGTANELFDEFAMSIRLTARLNNRGTCGRDVYWRLCVYDAHSAHAFHHCVRLYLCVCVCGTCWSRTIHSYRICGRLLYATQTDANVPTIPSKFWYINSSVLRRFISVALTISRRPNWFLNPTSVEHERTIVSLGNTNKF